MVTGEVLGAAQGRASMLYGVEKQMPELFLSSLTAVSVLGTHVAVQGRSTRSTAMSSKKRFERNPRNSTDLTTPVSGAGAGAGAETDCPMPKYPVGSPQSVGPEKQRPVGRRHGDVREDRPGLVRSVVQNKRRSRRRAKCT
jgi:hypothetical protein